LYDDLEYGACMRLTFDCIPKSRHGTRIGRGSDAELRLPEFSGVSTYHFSLTFDANYSLIVRDLGPLCGTTVI
jgi:pSer/pThr/pTyr-binding forkhead associated (FHA) protein